MLKKDGVRLQNVKSKKSKGTSQLTSKHTRVEKNTALITVQPTLSVTQTTLNSKANVSINMMSNVNDTNLSKKF